MNAKSKAKLHEIAEKWLGKECIVLHVPETLSPGKAADLGEVALDCLNIGKMVVAYRPGYGLRVCSSYAGRVWAGVPLQHPKATPFAWWKSGTIRLAV